MFSITRWAAPAGVSGALGRGSLPMGYLAMWRLWRALRNWTRARTDILPPYYIAEGTLEAKDAGADGKFYIIVAGARVQVDGATYEILGIGEQLKVRHTRGGRAINIDRFMPEDGPG